MTKITGEKSLAGKHGVDTVISKFKELCYPTLKDLFIHFRLDPTAIIIHAGSQSTFVTGYFLLFIYLIMFAPTLDYR